MKKRLPIILTLLLVCIAVSYASAANVVASPQNLSVDGVDADCDKYNIDGSNYFKLRDLAQLLSKTDSRFSVSFDEQSNAVTVVSGKEYTPVGGELERGRDQSKTAVVSKQSVLIDGKAADGLSVYNIGGNNYFKLRDLGDALGFTVDYDADSNTAIVLSKGSTAVYQNAFEKLLKDVNEKRRADMAREESFDGFEAYLQHHRGEVEITQAEIDSLKNLNNPGKAVLTRAEALEDVDLFFRALHYSYGAYYYFGEETFQRRKMPSVQNLHPIRRSSGTSSSRSFTRTCFSFGTDISRSPGGMNRPLKKAFSIFTITAVKALAEMKAGTICWGKPRSGTIPPAATRMSK